MLRTWWWRWWRWKTAKSVFCMFTRRADDRGFATHRSSLIVCTASRRTSRNWYAYIYNVYGVIIPCCRSVIGLILFRGKVHHCVYIRTTPRVLVTSFFRDFFRRVVINYKILYRYHSCHAQPHYVYNSESWHGVEWSNLKMKFNALVIS